MEKLLAYAILLHNDFEIDEEYQNLLDNMFINNPKDDILLDLEFLASDIHQTVYYIRKNIDYNNFDKNIFGKFLMKKLKEYYNIMNIKTFSVKMYGVWLDIPELFQDDEPFYTLYYADDTLSWQDEKQTKELFDKMFNYYN